MPLLRPDYVRYDSESARLANLAANIGQLEATHQKAVAEIIHLRLFDLLSAHIEVVASKVSSGAVYLDGSRPNLLIPRLASIERAIDAFRNLNRARPRWTLPWTERGQIDENVKHVIDAADNFRQTIDRHSVSLDEMRQVRNRIAHGGTDARTKFQNVVRRYYGARMNHISPGTLLLSSRIAPNLLSQFFAKGNILAKELVKI